MAEGIYVHDRMYCSPRDTLPRLGLTIEHLRGRQQLHYNPSIRMMKEEEEEGQLWYMQNLVHLRAILWRAQNVRGNVFAHESRNF